MVEASTAERHLHTSHGMHLNPKGKIWLAEKICEAAEIGSIQLEHLPSSNLRTLVDSTINLGNDKSTQEDPPPLNIQHDIKEDVFHGIQCFPSSGLSAETEEITLSDHHHRAATSLCAFPVICIDQYKRTTLGGVVNSYIGTMTRIIYAEYRSSLGHLHVTVTIEFKRYSTISCTSPFSPSLSPGRS
ncbi:hypothetical protein J6590_068775 [Homalodisca vitripennis]|nr:hypothetical protein J6590_068775 [Homalodisca vitripennis]